MARATSAETALDEKIDGKVIELTQAEYDALAEVDPKVIYVITDAVPVNMADYVKKVDFNSYSAATKTAMDNETSARTNADTAEQTAREAADSFISGAVDTLSTALANEAQRAQNAESGLSEDIEDEMTRAMVIEDALQDAIDAVSGNVETETARAEAAESDLDDKIDAVSAATDDALSGKQDTLVSGTNIKTINNESLLGSGNIDIQGGGGKAIEAGRGISVTTGETADTVSFNLPISADSNTYINAGVGNTNNNTALNILIGSGNTAYNGNNAVVTGGTAIGFGNEVGYIGRANFSKSYSFAFGYGNKIQGGHSYTIGDNNNIGRGTSNSKDKSFLIGYYNTCTFDGDSSGDYIFGNYCTVSKSDEFALGKYNVSNTGSTDADKTFFSIGNGTSTSARHNAFEIRQNGDIYITKDGQDVKLQDALGGITSGDVETMISAATSGYTARFEEDEEVTAAALNNLNDRVTEDEEVTAAALNNLNDNKADASDVATLSENISTVSASTAANTTALGGLKLVKITQSAYDALSTKDANTLYIIID